VLHVSEAAYAAMIAHAYDGLPNEACGLLVGSLAESTAPRFEPCRNAAESSRVYTIDSRDHFRVYRETEDAGIDIVGVMHSHTHTEAYPSPTDVAQAPDPEWHYVIVSLRQETPVLRSYRIVDGTITEEPVAVQSEL
jgi:proteasome lid subunit RPN8/RPN11